MKKILIVNDSPTISQQLTEQILANIEVEISYATDGTEAVLLAKEELPDLIFMDIVMPGHNGFQSTKMIKQDPQTSEIRVVGILQRDRDETTNEMWMRRSGAEAFVYYPFEVDEIAALIKMYFSCP